jgi:hypothetical protein
MACSASVSIAPIPSDAVAFVPVTGFDPGACSGSEYIAVDVSECPSAGCGTEAYALCDGTAYTECACDIPSGWTPVVYTGEGSFGGAGDDGGASDDGGGDGGTGDDGGSDGASSDDGGSDGASSDDGGSDGASSDDGSSSDDGGSAADSGGGGSDSGTD